MLPLAGRDAQAKRSHHGKQHSISRQAKAARGAHQTRQHPRHREVGPEIVGGTRVPEGTYPFATFVDVDLGGGDGYTCTGSLIDPLHVLTAAHCVENEDGTLVSPAQYTLVIGRTSHLTPDAANVFTVASVAQHPGWDRVNATHDVAVLKLTQAVPAAIAQPIALVGGNDTRFDTPGQPVIAAGWGRTSGLGKGSPDLLEATLSVISDRACDVAIRGGVDDASVLCTQQPAKNTCNGDSGGPLFVAAAGTTAAKHHAKQGSSARKVQAAGRKGHKHHHGHGYGFPPLPPPMPPTTTPLAPAPAEATLIGVTSFGLEGCAPGGAGAFAQLSAPLIHDFITAAQAR
jgi:secreted trypsin-like serine protease